MTGPVVRWLRRGIVPAALILALPAIAAADRNLTPIAVPVTGTHGPASLYPSSITVTPAAGPSHNAVPQVILHNVTHPCPEDLVVLLVHGTRRQLLMSGAGGCRPLAGTTIRFIDPDLGSTTPLPDTDSGPAHGAMLTIAPSVYDPAPILPAPAPAGPYSTAFASGTVAGSWELYVYDRDAAARGVIEAGWSLNYDSRAWIVNPTAAAIPTIGAAPVMDLPIAAAPGTRVRGVSLAVRLTHIWPDDLEIVLQSPSGTTALVMNDAGGSGALSSALIGFRDDAAGPPPNGAGIVASTPYRPGASYGTLLMATPVGPHGATFSVFDGELAAGTWRLYVNDDESPDGGTVEGAFLFIDTEFTPAVGIDTPTSTPTTTTTRPFLGLGAEIVDLDGPYTATWRNVVDGTYYASGPMRFGPSPSDIVDSTVPLKAGTNVVTLSVRNVAGVEATDTLTVTVPSFDYYLAEGATGTFFETDVSVFNPYANPASLTTTILPEGGSPLSSATTLAATSAVVTHLEDLVPAGSASTIVRSAPAGALAIERTMRWGADGYGGHGGTAVEGAATRWLFAEGAQGFFDTFVLLTNDNAAAATATVRFLRETGGPVAITRSLPPHSRTTIWAGAVAGLVGTSFGIEVTATAPIIAERAMYFPSGASRPFEGGHGTAGVTAASRSWFLAEGATGPFFECFILLSNPGSAAANVTLTYLLPAGTTVTQTITIPANARRTVNVETVSPLLANTPVSTTVLSDQPIAVERAMYWPDISVGWQEAHDSFGVTEPSLHWGVADARVGGPAGYQSFILIANPNPHPAEVGVLVFRRGSPTPIVRIYTLPATSRTNVNLASDFPSIGDGAFSVTVSAFNATPVVVEKAMYWNAGGVVWAAGTGIVATRLPPP